MSPSNIFAHTALPPFGKSTNLFIFVIKVHVFLFSSGGIGSPLVIERGIGFTQIGIASFYEENCAYNNPSGFTRTVDAAIWEWITQNAF